ncbi:MAG: type II secretion system F family protein [Planctomycetota bacterium]|jgi:type IV pilus assembly protein PilC
MSDTATTTSDPLDLNTQQDKPAVFGSGPDSAKNLSESRSKTSNEQIRASSLQSRHSLHRTKVKQSELILFTTQLSVMLDSGVVLSDALDAIAAQSENDVFKRVIIDVAQTVKSGEYFSRALSVYPRIFNSMFVSMVRASEASGTMAEMLKVLSGYLDFEMETRKQIKGALTYPFIMALMAVAATGTLMFFVLPRFMRIYEAKGAALPAITQVLVGFSKMLGNFELMTILVTVLIVTSIALHYWAGTAGGRRIIDYAKIHTPVLGTMFVDTLVTRSMRIMATMLNTGVSLLDTIQVIQGSCENHFFRQLWIGVDERIRDGYQLSEAITLSPSSELISPGIVQMLRAGEKSGKLGQVSDKVSVFYEKKLEASIKTVMAAIEPLMITILGGIIGTIAIALLLPVFRISSVIAH